jgi:hypothetical protein
MNRNDILDLILDHAANQGLYSVDYITNLMAMDDIALAAELDSLETIAVYGGF